MNEKPSGTRRTLTPDEQRIVDAVAAVAGRAFADPHVELILGQARMLGELDDNPPAQADER
jgi:hypothetical protein